MLHIEKMRRLGTFVTEWHQFTRKDRKKSNNLRNIHRKDIVARAVYYDSLKLTTEESSVRNINESDPLFGFIKVSTSIIWKSR